MLGIIPAASLCIFIEFIVLHSFLNLLKSFVIYKTQRGYFNKYFVDSPFRVLTVFFYISVAIDFIPS